MKVGIYSKFNQATFFKLMGHLCVLAYFILLSQNAYGQIKLAFGSCNKTHLDQSFWEVIDSEELSAWIWLGDIVYADSENPKVIEKKFKILRNHEFYKSFKKKNNIYGVWDDHDYGTNDGGKEFSAKKESRDVLFNFLDIRKKDPAWKRSGAYQSHLINSADVNVRLILLDVRYFRDELLRNNGEDSRYVSDEKADILGEEQWDWLELEFQRAEEDLILIGSGTQIIPVEHPYEKWSDYPSSRNQLLNLVKKYNQIPVVFLSGDRHMAEVSALAISPDRMIYEITSSGLTHAWTDGGYEPNSYRIRDLIRERNYGILQIEKINEILHVNAQIKSIGGHLIDSYDIIPK